MRERALANEADGHDISGTWFLDTCGEFYYILFLLFADMCDPVRRVAQDPSSANQVSKQGQEIGTSQARTSVRLS